MSELDELATRYKCPYCMALPGVWCRTDTGNTSRFLHGQRTSPIFEAFGKGYEEGLEWGKELGEKRARKVSA